jgi:hypothetical protein
MVTFRIMYSAARELTANLAEGSGEVLGLVLGSHTSEAICIERYEPLILAGRTSPDQNWLRAAVGRFFGGVPSPIGFFRTQIGGSSEMTTSDHDVVGRYLPHLPLQSGVFIVIQTLRRLPWSATVFGLDYEGDPASEPILDFPFNENLLRKRFSSDFVPTFEPQPGQTPGPPPPPEIRERTRSAQSVAEQPKTEIQIDPLDPRNWAILAALIGGLFGVALAYNGLRPAARCDMVEKAATLSEPLGLKVARTGNEFEISWDRVSDVVRRASAGTLTIRDGEITRIVDLDGTQLRGGKILYSPLFRELSFKLEIDVNSRSVGSESIQVLGWDTRQSGRPRPASAPANESKRSVDPGARDPQPRASQPPAEASNEIRSNPAKTPEAPKAVQAELPKSSTIAAIDSGVTVLPPRIPDPVRALPAPPTDLQVTVTAPTRVSLSWTNNAPDATAINIEVKKLNSQSYDLGQALTLTATGITNLQPNETYTFRVQAQNAAGFSPYSSPVTVTLK